MKPSLSIYRTLPRRDCQRPSAVTIGNFDGVHRGHQAIIARVKAVGDTRGLVPTVMTFEPHPRAYFARRGRRPELAPTQISGLRDKLTALSRHGIEQIALLRFNQNFASLSATDFIERLLHRGLNTRWLLVGEDFRYGHQRSGDIDMLRENGRRLGFEVETIADIVDTQGHRVSSTDLRTALAVGDLERAAHLQGHRYEISGHVIHGQKLGRNIGYPTINLRVPTRCALRSGVYVVRVHGLSDSPLPGIASLGVRPTVNKGGRLLLEVHLLDCRVNAYGKLACVEFLQYVRDEETFPDLLTMIAAIDKDAQCARDYFASHGL